MPLVTNAYLNNFHIQYVKYVTICAKAEESIITQEHIRIIWFSLTAYVYGENPKTWQTYYTVKSKKS